MKVYFYFIKFSKPEIGNYILEKKIPKFNSFFICVLYQ